MADIPQEVREAANAFFRDERTGLSVKFNLGHDPDPLLDAMNAMFLAGKRTGMERAAVIADDHARNAWTIGQQEGQNDVCSSGRNHGARAIAQAIRSEADGHG